MVVQPVIRKIVKEIVKPVATENDGALHRTFSLQRAIHPHEGSAMEMEAHAFGEAQNGATIHAQAIVHHVRALAGQGGIGGKGDTTKHNHVLPISFELHLLVKAALQKELERIAKQEGIVLVARVNGDFDKDVETIAIAHLDICKLDATHAIDIHAEARPSATGQTDRGKHQRFASPIIDLEQLGAGADGGKYGVEPHRVSRKLQQSRRGGGVGLLVITRCEQG